MSAASSVPSATVGMPMPPIRHLPVDDGRLVGVLSIGDLAKATLRGQDFVIRHRHITTWHARGGGRSEVIERLTGVLLRFFGLTRQ